MEQKEKSNQLLSQLMQGSKLEMPFSDFEETVMQRIHKESLYRQNPALDRKLSFFFFLLGTVLGLVINSSLQKLEINFPVISKETFILVFQLGFAMLFLLQLEKFIKSAKQKRRLRSIV